MLKYVTKGHEPIDASYGDLNDDGILDLVIITAPINEESVLSNNGDLARDLLIFVRHNQKTDSLILALKTSKAIPKFNSCDTIDSYGGHIAWAGTLTINKSCINKLRYRSEYRFGYTLKANDWFLDTIITESYPYANDKYLLDTFTKKDFGTVSLRTFDINKAKRQIR